MKKLLKVVALFGGGFAVGRWLRPHGETTEGLKEIKTEVEPDFPEPRDVDELLEFEAEDGYRVYYADEIIGKVFRESPTEDSQWKAHLWYGFDRWLPGNYRNAEHAARNLRLALP